MEKCGIRVAGNDCNAVAYQQNCTWMEEPGSSIGLGLPCCCSRQELDYPGWSLFNHYRFHCSLPFIIILLSPWYIWNSVENIMNWTGHCCWNMSIALDVTSRDGPLLGLHQSIWIKYLCISSLQIYKLWLQKPFRIALQECYINKPEL